MRNKTLQEKMIHVQSSMYEYTIYYLFYSRNQWLYWAENEFNRIQWCHSLLVRATKQVGSKSQVATENLCGSIITLGHPRINKHALFFLPLSRHKGPRERDQLTIWFTCGPLRIFQKEREDMIEVIYRVWIQYPLNTEYR